MTGRAGCRAGLINMFFFKWCVLHCFFDLSGLYKGQLRLSFLFAPERATLNYTHGTYSGSFYGRMFAGAQMDPFEPDMFQLNENRSEHANDNRVINEQASGNHSGSHAFPAELYNPVR